MESRCPDVHVFHFFLGDCCSRGYLSISSRQDNVRNFAHNVKRQFPLIFDSWRGILLSFDLWWCPEFFEETPADIPLCPQYQSRESGKRAERQRFPPLPFRIKTGAGAFPRLDAAAGRRIIPEMPAAVRRANGTGQGGGR
jgi:hypothetical protein